MKWYFCLTYGIVIWFIETKYKAGVCSVSVWDWDVLEKTNALGDDFCWEWNGGIVALQILLHFSAAFDTIDNLWGLMIRDIALQWFYYEQWWWRGSPDGHPFVLSKGSDAAPLKPYMTWDQVIWRTVFFPVVSTWPIRGGRQSICYGSLLLRRSIWWNEEGPSLWWLHLRRNKIASPPLPTFKRSRRHSSANRPDMEPIKWLAWLLSPEE